MDNEETNPPEPPRERRKRLFTADEIDAAHDRLSHGLTSLDIHVDEFSIRSVNQKTGKEIIIELFESNEADENPLDSERLSDISTIGYLAGRVSKPGKDKCGDSFVARKIPFEKIILLAVSDGVSSSPCDWRASEEACDALVKKFARTAGGIEDRLLAAAQKSHAEVRRIEGKCSGSLASLSIVAWEIGSEEFCFLNVGDSRVYVGPEHSLEQVTKDDIVVVPVRRDGELVLNAGVPVFMRGVTRSLGQVEPLELKVLKHRFSVGDLMMLVTDGVTKDESFVSKIPEILGASDPEARFSQFLRESSTTNRDDASMIIVWRADINDEIRRQLDECLKTGSDYRSVGIGRTQMQVHLRSDIRAKLDGGLNDEVRFRLDYATLFGLRFDREFLAGILSTLISQGTDRELIARVRDLIRLT